MTRGMKGCYIYCTDKETAAYFRSRIGSSASEVAHGLAADGHAATDQAEPKVLPFRRVSRERLKPYRNAVPLVDLKIAAGTFGET